jgi:hypothetical protein
LDSEWYTEIFDVELSIKVFEWGLQLVETREDKIPFYFALGKKLFYLNRLLEAEFYLINGHKFSIEYPGNVPAWNSNQEYEDIRNFIEARIKQPLDYLELRSQSIDSVEIEIISWEADDSELKLEVQLENFGNESLLLVHPETSSAGASVNDRVLNLLFTIGPQDPYGSIVGAHNSFPNYVMLAPGELLKFNWEIEVIDWGEDPMFQFLLNVLDDAASMNRYYPYKSIQDFDSVQLGFMTYDQALDSSLSRDVLFAHFLRYSKVFFSNEFPIHTLTGDE